MVVACMGVAFSYWRSEHKMGYRSRNRLQHGNYLVGR
jgi:hypothetical protein